MYFNFGTPLFLALLLLLPLLFYGANNTVIYTDEEAVGKLIKLFM